MPRQLGYNPSKQSEKRFNQRVKLLLVIMFTLALLLLARLFYLQIIEHHYYLEQAERNQSNLVAVEPRRGIIYDRNGVVLADNIPVYSLMIQRDQIKNLKETVNELKNLLNLTDKDTYVFWKDLKNHPRFAPIPLVDRLTEQQIAIFMLNQYRFPGVSVKTIYIRHYPYGAAFAPAIGYVSRINKEELKKVDPDNYSASTNIGKSGIEKYFETQLHGRIGFQHVLTDASGKIIRELGQDPATPGDNLTLTLDSRLQEVAYQAFDGQRGALVAIQPGTGQVLALVSSPSFDPNLFVDGIDSKTYQALQKNPNQPLFNRAVRGLFPFGSTIKPFYAAGGLDSGAITPDYTIYDPGYFKLPGVNHIYRDWTWAKKHAGHGTVNVTKAIEQSCDTFFYSLAVKVGINSMDNTLSLFGFGQKTGVEIPEELPGLVASPDWKMKRFKQKWFAGDTVSAGIGQGYMLTTPIELAQGTAIIADQGLRPQTTLLLKTQLPNGTIIDNKPPMLPAVKLKQNTWDVVINGMRRVIEVGTGSYHFGQKEFGKPTFSAAGKTGTAQVFSLKGAKYNKNMLPTHLRDNTLFIVFAPVENPQIAVAVILQNNETAGDIARKVVDYYLNEILQNKAPASLNPDDPNPLATINTQTGTAATPSITTNKAVETTDDDADDEDAPDPSTIANTSAVTNNQSNSDSDDEED